MLVTRARKQELRYYAEHLKKLMDETNPQVPIVVYYEKREERIVKKIYAETFGPDCRKLTFEERPVSDSETNIRLIRFGLAGFLFFMIFTVIFIFVALFTGIEDRWVDLPLFIGNVGGVACSIYILRSSFVLKSKLFLFIGLMCLIFNGYQVFNFFDTYAG